jgi:hypothetical protein
MLIAGSVTASGGIAAIAIRKFAVKNVNDYPHTQSPTQSKEDQHG